MGQLTALAVISYWEELKDLINNSSTIYADPMIHVVDQYLKQQTKNELI